MQTARFVRHEGDQLELVLRIRQGHNASFAFLRPDSPLYDYYRWLVHAQPQVSILSDKLVHIAHLLGRVMTEPALCTTPLPQNI